MKAVINGKLVYPEEIREGILLIDGDRIVGLRQPGTEKDLPAGTELIDAQGLYVGPGLIDEHCHGYKQRGLVLDVDRDVRAVALANLQEGTTSITPSLAYSLPKDHFLKIIDDCNEAIKAGDTNIIGMHFEGPFISPKHGANSELCWPYSDEVCEEIFSRAGKNVLHCTYAPELKTAPRLEAILKKHGITADIGHTAADPDSIYRAVKSGARIVTHLFDAMGNYRGAGKEVFELTGDPQECVSDIVLSIPGLYYELICDSRCAHVAAVSMRMALRCAGEDHIILISDATGRQGQLDPADYPPEDVRSATDLNFNARGQLSGSCLTVARSAQNFMHETGCGIRAAFKAASTNPAKALGVEDRFGSIREGKAANLVFVDEDFAVKQVIFRGSLLSR